MNEVSQATRVLSVFSLTMITVGSVDSIRNLPTTALFGSQLIFFFIFGALFFLIPAALVSAELASGWPKQGGIYVWVKEAFGGKTGFLAIWFQWIENVIWYPTILSFVAGTIGYLISPSLANEPYFLWSVIVSAFWGTTLVNIYGMRVSAFFSTFCTLCGLLLPMVLIIGLGGLWVWKGNPLQLSFDWPSLLPHWGDSSVWVSLTAIMLSFCGVEIATVHANEVLEPQKAFPRALTYSVLIILVTLILGSLAIAVVLPAQDISLVAGIMQAFHAFFAQYHALWLMPAVAIMLVIGGLGGVNNWLIAPPKGLLVAAHDGHLPLFLQHTNKRGVPTVLLVIQAVIVTVLSTLLHFLPSVNGAYWFLTALAAQLYMMMYLLMFAAVVKLRFSQPNQARAFSIPGGKLGVVSVAMLGGFGVLLTFFVSFIPPEGINVGGLVMYESLLLCGLVLMSLPPFLISWVQRRKNITLEKVCATI